MLLETLLKEPQLIEIKLDKPDLVERYGDAITFYIYDRQDMDTYMQLARLSGDGNLTEVAEVTKAIVRNKKGELILQGEATLPPDLMMAVIEEAVKNLGNLIAQTSESQQES